MEKIEFEEAVDVIIRRDRRYHRDAYFFLREVLDFTVKYLGRERDMGPQQHVSGPELLDGFRRYALDQFGPMVPTVLDDWGIHETGDIGNIVFNLIEEGAFGQSDQDRVEDFQNGYSFFNAFVLPYLPDDQRPSQADAPKTS